MYYEEEIRIEQAAELLGKCGLSVPAGVDYTLGIFDAQNRLAASGSLKGDMIQGVAVDPARQGEDLTGRLFTGLLRHAVEKGMASLCLFTKPEKAFQFEGLGFRTVVNARPYAALLEWGAGGIKAYKESLAAVRRDLPEGSKAACLVMNCNPFTLGHRWLIEQASAASSAVYVLVVEENCSLFSFKDRLEMVRLGTSDLENVVVIGGGRYAVSALTFPSYFTGEEKAAEAHTAVDAELFAQHIAPTLGVNVRYVGSEPFSPVTAVYNETLKTVLPKNGIEVRELQRLEADGEAVSASRVRRLLQDGAGHEELKELLPETTLNYIFSGGEASWHIR